MSGNSYWSMTDSMPIAMDSPPNIPFKKKKKKRAQGHNGYPIKNI